MVRLNSTSRLSHIEHSIILTQTDTTVGFLSQDETELQKIKSRPPTKPFITVYKDFKSLHQDNIRIPNSKKKILRRAKRTTFIVKEHAFRVVRSQRNSSLLENVNWFYSTSANESGKKFQRDFCEKKADIIIEDKLSLYEGEASKLYKINELKTRRLR